MMSSGIAARSATSVLARAVDRRVGELLDQHVGLAVDHAEALLDGCAADGLGEVALAGSRRTEEERVLVAVDELPGGELEDQSAVHLLVEVPVEGIEGAIGVAKLSRLDAPGEQPVGAPRELVGDERRDEVDRCPALGLSLQESRFEPLGHAAETELLQGADELDQVHGRSSSRLMRSITSR